MGSNDLDEIGQQLEIDARTWLEQEKPLELLYEGEQFDLAKEWVRQNAISVEAWEFFEACMINSLRYFAIGWMVMNASTEIRTPLGGILGRASILLKEPLCDSLNPEQIHGLEHIKYSAKMLLDMLGRAQEEAKKFDGKRSPG